MTEIYKSIVFDYFYEFLFQFYNDKFKLLILVSFKIFIIIYKNDIKNNFNSFYILILTLINRF